MYKESYSTPGELTPESVYEWLWRTRWNRIVAANRVCLLAVDFPPGKSGSCIKTCSYCYACNGRQATESASRLQWERYRAYLEAPERYAERLAQLLAEFQKEFRFALGTAGHPLRLFGAGDLGKIATFGRFHGALEALGVKSWGFSRFLGVPPMAQLWFSADRFTRRSEYEAAQAEGRRIAYVRFPDEKRVPDCVSLIFPEHSQKARVPIDAKRDCYKLRHTHSPGVCMFSCPKPCYEARVSVQAAHAAA